MIDAGEWVNAIRNGEYKELTERIREFCAQGKKNEAGELKLKLPAVVVAGKCPKGRFYRLTTDRTGWAMMDFDGLEVRQIEAAKELLKVYEWVVMLHTTSSGRGLRVVANIGQVHIDVYRDAYEIVATRLKEITGLEPDMQCKDFARASLASYDPDIYYNPQAKVFGYGSRNPLNYVPVTGPDSSEDFRMPEYNAVKDETYVEPALVIDRFFANNDYTEGSRHKTLLRLGGYMKWSGIQEYQLGIAMGLVCSRAVEQGMTEKEVRNAVMWGYRHGTENTDKNRTKSAHNAHFSNMSTVFQKQLLENTDNEDDIEKELEEEELINEYCRALPDDIFDTLPEELKKLLVIAKDERERDLILLSAIVNMSATFPALRTMYGNMKYSPHLYLALVAEAGAGKGIAMHASRLGQKINAELEKIYKGKKKEYEKLMIKWDMELKNAMRERRLPDMDMKPEEPARQVLIIMANISKSQLMIHMRAAQNEGVIMIASEIDVISESLNTDYGKHGAELRMFFHHEMVGQSFKTDKEPIVVENPKMAIMMTGTPEQLVKFMRSLENGMYSRFMFYTINRLPKWKSQSPLDGNGNVDVAELFDTLAEKLKVNFFRTKGKEIMINFTREQWDRHNEVFGFELELLMAEGCPNTAAIAIRAGLIMIRVAMVLCGLRIMEAGWMVNEFTCSDEDFNTAMEITMTCLTHSAHISTMMKTAPEGRKITNFYRLLPVLKRMKPYFRYFEFRDAVVSTGSNITAARRALAQYVRNGLVSRHYDGFKKTDKLRRMLIRKM